MVSEIEIGVVERLVKKIAGRLGLRVNLGGVVLLLCGRFGFGFWHRWL